jgi:divalent metal cation (Fe/Co/Zn/Cd) transporter
MSHGGGKKAIVAAFFANLLIAVSKFVVFLITGAASLLAESIHSLADTGNQGLLLHGGRAARRAPDEQHPFSRNSPGTRVGTLRGRSPSARCWW